MEELRQILCWVGQIGGHVSECHVEWVTNVSRDSCKMRPATGVTDGGQPCSQKTQLMRSLNEWGWHLRGSEAVKSPPKKEGTFGFHDRIGPRTQWRVTFRRSIFRASDVSGCQRRQLSSSAKARTVLPSWNRESNLASNGKYLFLHTGLLGFCWLTRKCMSKKWRQVQVWTERKGRYELSCIVMR